MGSAGPSVILAHLGQVRSRAVDTAVAIAIAGFLTTIATAIGVPYIQARIASLHAVADKLRDERMAAYADAMVYLRAVEGRLDDTTEDPDFRQSSYKWPDMPHRDLTTARLRLVAPEELLKRWDRLTSAWDAFSWNIQQDGAADVHGHYFAEETSDGVKRVRSAIRDLAAELRRSAGVGQKGDSQN